VFVVVVVRNPTFFSFFGLENSSSKAPLSDPLVLLISKDGKNL